MDLQEVEWMHGLINLAQDTDRLQALVKAITKLRVP